MKNLFEWLNRNRMNDERIGPELAQASDALRDGGACPPLEDIAALIERKLPVEKHDSLLTHLAGCDKCREIYVMASLMDQKEKPAEKTVYRGRAMRLAPVAIAAGLLLAIVSWRMYSSIKHENSGTDTIIQHYAKNPPPGMNIGEAAPVKPKAANPSNVRPKSVAPIFAEAKKWAVKPQATQPDFTSKDQQLNAQPEEIKVPEKPAVTEQTSGHKLIAINERQKRAIRKTGMIILDKDKIEGLFNDLKLDANEFPLRDITKVVVKWYRPSKLSNHSIKAESGQQQTAYADVSLGQGGVMTIVVPGKPPAPIAVGC